MSDITLAIASDHAGYALKENLKSYVQELGHPIIDLGTHSDASVDYPDYGHAIADAITQKQAALGIAICGSGIGISIAANRHAGIRCALVSDGLSAQLAREHNNANILALGARLIGTDMARECVRRFLSTAFAGGRHLTRVEKLR